MVGKVKRLRASVHSANDYLHFNNAGSSPSPYCVVEKMQEVLQQEHEFGGYYVQYQIYKDDLDMLYINIGKLINAPNPREEIALVDSATTAWVKAFYSVPLEKTDVIVTSHTEYGANYVAMLQQCKRSGASIVVIPTDNDGRVSLTGLKEIMKKYQDRVRFVCISWIPTNGGVINDAEGIGKICSQYNRAIYLLDACQAVGQLEIDVSKIQCDILSATGRKYLRGPRGTGFLFVKQSILPVLEEPVTIDHYSAPWVGLNSYSIVKSAKRFEQWERNVSALVGLNEAVTYCLEKVDMKWAAPRIQKLGNLLRESLVGLNSKIQGEKPKVVVYDLGTPQTRCGIVTFAIDKIPASSIKSILEEKKIFVSTSEPSSTLLDATQRTLPTLLRASIHYFNTKSEIQRFTQEIKRIIENFPHTTN